MSRAILDMRMLVKMSISFGKRLFSLTYGILEASIEGSNLIRLANNRSMQGWLSPRFKIKQ